MLRKAPMFSFAAILLQLVSLAAVTKLIFAGSNGVQTSVSLAGSPNTWYILRLKYDRPTILSPKGGANLKKNSPRIIGLREYPYSDR